MSKRKRKRKNHQEDDDDMVDWMSGSFTTVLDDKYDEDFGDIFGEEYDEEEDEDDIWDADDYILMADDDLDDDY